jgi:hypothetical protein
VLSAPACSSVCGGIVAPEPVDWARLKQWERMIELLKDGRPCNVQASDTVGRTALHYAAGYGEREAAAALLRSGAAVDAPDRFGATALHWACLKAQPHLVGLLLSASADPLVPATAGVFSGRSAVDLLRAHAEGSAVRAQLAKALGAAIFEHRKVLGRGGFGTVIKAVRRDSGLAVALKEVRKPTSRSGGGAGVDADALAAADGGGLVALRGARVERDALSAVSHPFVVRLHCAFQTRHHLYLALDYCGGGDLALHIRHASGGKLAEGTARFVCAELLLGLDALHAHGVMHRDVKTENVSTTVPSIVTTRRQRR